MCRRSDEHKREQMCGRSDDHKRERMCGRSDEHKREQMCGRSDEHKRERIRRTGTTLLDVVRFVNSRTCTNPGTGVC